MLETFKTFFEKWADVFNNTCGFCTTVRELMIQEGLADAYDKADVRITELKAVK